MIHELFQSSAACKGLLRKGLPPVPVQKTYSGLNEPINDRQIKFTISTDSKDRDNDIIRQDGWDLTSYVKNPVVLLNHKSNELPVAKCVGIGVEDGKLKATIEFVPATYPIVGDTAEAVFQLCKSGYMNATSVGFRPLKWDWSDGDDDGIVYTRQELLEFSIVSVPSNPQALIEPPSWFGQDAPKQAGILNTKDSLLRLRLRVLQLR